MTIHLTDNARKIIEKILDDCDYVYFGSRTKGTHQPYSDLDICIMNTGFTLEQLADLKRAFSESNLPFKVDLVVYEDVSPGFQQLIKKEGVR